MNPEMVTTGGINLHQPALLPAGLACVPERTGCRRLRISRGRSTAKRTAAGSGSRKRAARAGLPGLRPSEITHNGSPSRPRAGSSLNTRDEASHAIWLVGVRALLRVEARVDLEWLLGGLGARQRGLVTRSSYRPPTWAQLPAADVGAATGPRRGRSGPTSVGPTATVAPLTESG